MRTRHWSAAGLDHRDGHDRDQALSTSSIVAIRRCRRPASARRLGLTGVAIALLVLCTAASAGAASYFGGQGAEAEQFQGASGLALDSQTGDVYVSDQYNHRVDKYDGSGASILDWGWGINGSSPAPELQTCTVESGCGGAQSGSGNGEFADEGPRGIAVDNNYAAGDPSAGDVYVVDWEGFRVEKFDPEGKFLLMFGGGVNEAKDNTPGATEAEKDVCLAGEQCTRGVAGTGTGEFNWYYQPDGIIAVGPGGDIYVGDQGRVEIFEPDGAWKETISLATLSTEGKVRSLAVDGAGDVFLKDEGVPGVHEIEPGGILAPVEFDPLSESIEAITLDAAGNLYLAEYSNGGTSVFEYSAAGQELAEFASKTIGSQASFPNATATGMAFSNTLNQLYVSSTAESVVWMLTPPAPGPLIEPGTESATPESHGTAALQASLNPEGNETTYHFEYVGASAFAASGYGSATSTSPVSAGSGFGDQTASGELSSLAPGIYYYRLVATNSQGTATGPDQILDTALIEGPSADSVSNTSATLAASVDPLGTDTEYRLEYGTTTGYGHTISGNLGEGTAYVPISSHQQELQPTTEYHYRLVISDQFGVFEGPDHSFTTQGAGAELSLLDGRQWELVSPADKKGALIEPFTEGLIQAAANGKGIAYAAKGTSVGEGSQSQDELSTVLSTRAEQGWQTQNLSLPVSVSRVPEEYDPKLGGLFPYALFSPNLAGALVEPPNFGTPPLSAEVMERTVYIRNDLTSTFTPLVSPADVPPNTHFGGEENEKGELMVRILASTPDLHHVVLASALPLTPGAIAEPPSSIAHTWNLYEWNEGQGLQLVNMLPNEEQALPQPGLPMDIAGGSRLEGIYPSGAVPRAVSDDGRWVTWTIGDPYESDLKNWPNYRGLYVRDTVQGKTYRIGGAHALIQTMSSDGSRIFYRENGNLYQFQPQTATTTDLTAALLGTGERNAGVQEGMPGISEDGTYVYFVATGELAPGAAHGEYNLYLAHDGASGWSTTYIAALSPNDLPDWWAYGFGGINDLTAVTSRVSPSGRYMVFMSEHAVTGYDNTDAVSGKPDEEVYMYDAASDHLICVSCDPTGARPVGILDDFELGPQTLPLVDRIEQGAWSGIHGVYFQEAPPHWLAGSLPGWYGRNYQGAHQPRYLSDSGRVFFNSPDALVPQDTNGLEDVYEYEPSGVGGCTSTSPTFSVRSSGCVDLISSGTSSQESDFFDASESGDDAFFLTASKLVGADYDAGYDVYDAHVCSAAVPCASEPAVPPPCTSGDACKGAPSLQPAIFGAPASATFNGNGNVAGRAKQRPKSTPRRCAKGRVRRRGKCIKKHPARRRRSRLRKPSSRARNGKG